MKREYLDDIRIPRELYGRLRQRIANDLGYPNREALLEADNGDELDADALMDTFVAQAIEEKLKDKELDRIEALVTRFEEAAKALMPTEDE